MDAVLRTSRVTLSANVNRIGARDDYDYGYPGGRVRLAPYTLVGAAAELPIVVQHGEGFGLALTARGENLTNRSYENVFGFATPGRVLFVGVRLHE